MYYKFIGKMFKILLFFPPKDLYFVACWLGGY